jgi:RNA polymerase sigma-70 factor (ECF subfamily)
MAGFHRAVGRKAMTHNLLSVGGVDLTVGRFRPARPETPTAHARPARPVWEWIGSWLHGLRAVVQAASDESLMQSIAVGDRRALRALVSGHSVEVFRYALSITRDRPCAEQVLHDVFVEVWRSAGTFDGRTRVSTWLLTLTRNKAVSALERRPEPVRTNGAGQTLPARIRRLPSIDREIVNLVYAHRRSAAEIGDILGVPSSIVTARMFHARRKIAALESASTSQPGQAGPRRTAAGAPR